MRELKPHFPGGLAAAAWIFLLILFFSPAPLKAQVAYEPTTESFPLESWRWIDFPRTEGKSVLYMHEYQPNQVWFATNDGLLHFDGYEYRWHTAEQGLRGKPVHLVYVTKGGVTIAATDHGIFRYEEANRWTPILSWPQPGRVTYHSVTELSGQRLALGTSLGMICLQLGKPPLVYTDASEAEEVKKQLPEARILTFPQSVARLGTYYQVTDVLEDRRGNIWLAVGLEEEDQGYLLRLDDDLPLEQQMAEAELFSSNTERDFAGGQKLLEAQDGKIWVINNSYRIGVNIYDEGQWSTLNLGDQHGGDEYATSICQTENGNIWIGGLGRLYSFDGDRWQLYQAPEYKVPGNKMLLFPALDGSLWVMGIKSRVIFVDHSQARWVAYPGLNYQDESAQGTWFLDREGRAVLQRSSDWIAYDADEGLMDAPVRIIVTSAGQVWAAGSHQGQAATAYLQGNRWVKQLHPELSWGIDYRAVFEDRDGNLWFGGSVDIAKERGQKGGLLQLQDPLGDAQAWVHHHQDNGLKQSNAYGLGQSDDGRIWVGGGRLWAYDGVEWAQVEQPNLQEFVNEVASTDGLLLVGSRYYGVYVYDGQTWQNYDTDSGLISNTIISLYADSASSIWAITENDISRFDGQKWVNHVLPTDMNMDFEGGELLRSADGACWINKSSREWKRRALSYSQMTTSASDHYITYRYYPDDHPPETELLNHPEEVAAEGNLILAWQGHDYLSLTGHEWLEYSFRLDGGEWSVFSPETKHVFTNLSGGEHRIEVRARDLDFNVDPTPALLSFRVQVPVWREPWFIGLIVIFLVTLGIFEYRILVKNQTLGRLNGSLRQANDELKEQGEQIMAQNKRILTQQSEILEQKNRLERAHERLAASHDRIEQQRDALEDMVAQVEQLSKAKLNFFTNVSHELRTPLSLLLGPIEQLLRCGEEMPTARRQELLQLVSRNANRLLILINQLLEIRKIESDSLQHNPQPGHLLHRVQATMDLFQNLSQMRSVNLHLDNRLPQPWLNFDHDKVEKILANLVSNAFKHTPDHGNIQLTLEVREEREEQGPEKAWVCLTVEDDGVGISAQDQAHIFDRYYTGQHEQPLSTGIGLSYIRDLIHIQGGDISLQSQEGEGTVVTVKLPYEPCAPQQQAILPGAAPGLPEAHLHVASLSAQASPRAGARDEQPRKRILIVEDNPDMRQFLKSMFDAHYRVLEACNGRKGLEMAREKAPDLIISDIMMPEMDGMAFCRELKGELLTSHVPVILLTARNQNLDKVEGYHLGADDYITKPFQPEVLEARVDNLLKQREQLRRLYQQRVLMRPQEVVLESPDEKMLAKLSQLMEEHVDDPEFNVNKMCEAVDMSHMQFIRKIKQLTGKKPIELLKSFRLTRAQDLLRQNKLTISEVAYLVGYDLPNSFSRAFKKEFGISPTEFLEREVELASVKG